MTDGSPEPVAFRPRDALVLTLTHLAALILGFAVAMKPP